MPVLITFIHMAFLVGVVVFAHHPAVFMALLLFFLGFTSAYKKSCDNCCNANRSQLLISS